MKGVSQDLAAKLKLMEQAALAAGREIYATRQAQKELTKKIKADGSIVLPLDIECQKIVLKILGQDLPVVGEEDASSHKLIQTEKSFYLVDPIDGTSACRRFLQAGPGQVGFGPLIGFVDHGKLSAAVYLDFLRSQLFSAVRDVGTCVTGIQFDSKAELPELSKRGLLSAKSVQKLSDCAALFYIGNRIRGEVGVVESLRHKDLIETVYRFGGFANDCSRLAQGFEQIIVQFHVKPWDASAILIPLQSGYSVIFDPLTKRTSMEDWKLAPENPLIIVPTHLKEQFIKVLEEITF